MPNPNAIVSKTIRFEPRLERSPAELLRAEGGISVELDGGRRVRLDPANHRSPGLAQVLEGLGKQRMPVYLEIDPATSFIKLLLIPHVTRVIGIRPVGEGNLAVELERSHARHLLRGNAPDFGELERQLRDALEKRLPVIVSETDAHEIIDIRGYTPDPEGPLPLPPFPEPRLPRPRPPWWWFERIWYWRWWPWWWFRCVSAAKAQQVFDAMSATSCNPLTVPPPCIPFLYPDDGCWARAHEMCRLMINMGLSPRKVWIDGNLHVNTKNNPNCFVNWGWHVAPTLCVCGPGIFSSQTMVIDPSLFTTPVSEATWKGVQGDPAATLTETDASDYLWGATDPTYSDTNFQLNKYRLKLQARAVQFGAPPYANCP